MRKLKALRKLSKAFETDIVDKIIKPFNMDILDGIGNTPLHYAAAMNHVEVVKEFLKP